MWKITGKGNKRGVVIEIDIENAYDKIDWDFVDYVMARKGFPQMVFLDVWVSFFLSLLDYLKQDP